MPSSRGPAKRLRPPASPRLTLLHLPDGVLCRIFAELSASPDDLILTGRAVDRAYDALALAHASRRHLDVFRASLRTLKLDGAENPLFDADQRLAALLRLARPHLRDLSLKWFERASLRPALAELANHAPHLRSLSLHGVHPAFPPAQLVHLLAAVAPRLECVSLVSIAWFCNAEVSADAALFALADGPARLRSFEVGPATALSHCAFDAVWRAAGAALRSVDLHEVAHPTVGDHTLLALAARCTQVRALNIASVDALSTDALERTCAALSASLDELCLESHNPACSAVSDATALRVVRACPLLTSVCFAKPRAAPAAAAIDASSCWRRTDTRESARLTARWPLAASAALGTRLRKLSVYDPPGFADPQLAAVARACPNLTSVGLRACTQVTSAGVAALAASCADRLRSVDVSGCARVCDAGIRALARHSARSLEFAWLADLPLLSLRAVRTLLRAAAPTLKDINLGAARFAATSAARVVRATCRGPRLECVVLDNAGASAERESTYEIERLRGGVRCPALREQLELLRAACPNALIILERALPDSAPPPEIEDDFDPLPNLAHTTANLYSAMAVEL